MWKKFKEFAFKGNVIDMAVGVVIGGAFGKIVSSFVADIITPLISLITGKANFTELLAVGPVNFGAFIQNIIDFFIIALSIFCFVSIIQKAREKSEAKKKAAEAKEEAPAEDPKPTTEELLAEIRDLLKDKKD